MFGLIKSKMKDYYFKNKEDTAFHIMKEMFGLNLKYIQGFFKKTLQNMLFFWFKLNWEKFKEKIRKNLVANE